jgi:hypothetical protein
MANARSATERPDASLTSCAAGTLAERSAGACQPHRHAAALGRGDPPDRGEDHRERGAAHANADKQAHADHQQETRRGVRRHGQASGECQRTEADDGRRAVAVGGGAGEGLRESPDQIVQGDRHGDGAERDAAIEGDRVDEQAERLANPHRRTEDEGAGDDDRRGCASLIHRPAAPWLASRKSGDGAPAGQRRRIR